MLLAVFQRWGGWLWLIWLALAVAVLPQPPAATGAPYDVTWGHWWAVYGIGGGLSIGWVWQSGRWPALRPLFGETRRGALYGAWQGTVDFALLLACAGLLLYVPPLQPYLPIWAVHLIGLFDPWPLYFHWETGVWPVSWRAGVAVTAGSALEEWWFRALLLWLWCAPERALAAESAGGSAWLLRGRLALKICGVSLLFAVLHLPQGPESAAVAFAGSSALGALLLWRRNLPRVAALHVLFNCKTLLF